MKKVLVAVISLTIISTANATTYVRSHYRTNGTYVQGHYRSSPDGVKWNNYSYSGNTNPFTGKKGYKSN